MWYHVQWLLCSICICGDLAFLGAASTFWMVHTATLPICHKLSVYGMIGGQVSFFQNIHNVLLIWVNSNNYCLFGFGLNPLLNRMYACTHA